MPTLDFKGKPFVYSHHLAVSFRELVVDAKKSLSGKVEPSLDDNLIIHGDNLEALKALLPRYAGKVDVIYIDPPYNTGNEGWAYDDNVNSPLMKEWLGKVVDKDDLERHDKWLCMMWPRLQLLKELLSQSGFVAIHIDDNEVHNLSAILDEVFGADKRLACIPWLTDPSGGKQKSALRVGHEYLLVYGTSGDTNLRKEMVAESGEVLADQHGEYRIGRELNKWGDASLRENRPEQWFALKAPDGSEVLPIRNDGREGRWRWGKNNPKIKALLADPSVAHWEMRSYEQGVKYKGKKERWFPYEKIREAERRRGWSTWLDEHGYNADGTRELTEIFGSKVFDTPKPREISKWVLRLHGDDHAVVLDSFAGSGTSAHACLELNQEDSGARRFLLVECEEYADRHHCRARPPGEQRRSFRSRGRP